MALPPLVAYLLLPSISFPKKWVSRFVTKRAADLTIPSIAHNLEKRKRNEECGGNKRRVSWWGKKGGSWKAYEKIQLKMRK